MGLPSSASDSFLLWIIAPFQTSINLNLVENYYLQPLSKYLPNFTPDFEQFRNAISAFNHEGGLTIATIEGWDFAMLNPYFTLQLRQNFSQNQNLQQSLYAAFQDYGHVVASHCFNLFTDTDLQKRDEAALLVRYELDNFLQLIDYALTQKKAPVLLFTVSHYYYSFTRQKHQSIDVAIRIISEMEIWIQNYADFAGDFISILTTLGEAYSDLNKHDQAIEAFKKGLIFLENAALDPDEFHFFYGGLYLDLGMAEAKSNRYEPAKEYLNQALQYFTPDRNANDIAKINMTLGIMALRTGNHQEADQYFLELEHFYQSQQSILELGYVLINRAVVAEELDEYESSALLYKQALAIFTSHNDVLQVAYIEQNLGVLYAKTDDLDQALSRFKRSFESFIQLDDLYYQAVSLQNLGTCSYKLTNYDDSLDYLCRSLNLFAQLGKIPQVQGVMVNFQTLHELSGNDPWPFVQGILTQNGLENYLCAD